ncbi:hypothetical protein Tco_0433086 [Tanacetum coccineum]
MLKVSPRKGVIRFRKRGKLNPRYIGPFNILERIGPVAYKLELPKELSNVHSTFYVFNLNKCLSDESLVIPMKELQLDDKLNFVEEPIEIMDRKVKQLRQSRTCMQYYAKESPIPPSTIVPPSLMLSLMLIPQELFPYWGNSLHFSKRDKNEGLGNGRGESYNNEFDYLEAELGISPKRTSTSEAPTMTQAAIRKLVVDSVTATLEAQAAIMANAAQYQ